MDEERQEYVQRLKEKDTELERLQTRVTDLELDQQVKHAEIERIHR